MTEAEKRALREKRSKIPCRGFAAGRCRYGDRCQYLHADGGGSGNPSKTGACTELVDSDADDEFAFDTDEFDEFDCGECHREELRADDDDREKAVICQNDGAIEWVVDTGTENHLVMSSKIDLADPNVHSTKKPMRLATANGTIVADKRIDMDIPELGVKVDPLILDQTVDAISVGRLVMDESYSFHWPCGQPAYFEDREGRVIKCSTKGYVPVITSEHEGFAAMPSVGNQADHPDADVDDQESREEKLKREARSPEHCLTHMRKNPYCWVCSMTKMVAKQARRLGPEHRNVNPENFGDHVCADHVTGLNEEKEMVEGHQAALFIIDLHTRFPCLAPVRDKSAESAARALRYYMGTTEMKTLYSDNSKELEVASRDVAQMHVTSTPYRPQSNSIAERGIRTLLEATRSALVQAGMPCRFWPMAGSHQSFAIAISEQLNGEPSPYEIRNGVKFDGWRLPFGSLVHYRPPRPMLKGLPKFAPRSVPGIFVGWHVEPGCRWKGDYLIIPLSSFKQSARRFYQAHRTKELVSFDPVNFPLQAAFMEEMVKVQPIPARGEKEWPDQVHHEVDDESPMPSKSAIDLHYEDVIGKSAPPEMSHDEKFEEIAYELFGPEEDEDVKSDEHEVPGEPGSSRHCERRGENEGDGLRIPRGRRIFLPGMNRRAETTSPCVTMRRGGGQNDDAGYKAMVARAAEIPSPAPRRKISPMSDRRLIEYCCAPDSLLGKREITGAGCVVVRLTAEHDLTTKAGLDHAIHAVASTPKDQYIHLWGSLPCTAGSPWQRINRARNPGAEEKIERMKEIMKILLKNFVAVGEEVLARGGDVSFEWPAACELWKHPDVEEMVQRFALNKVNMHGCAAGLRSAKTGLPIKKPWTIATTAPSIVAALGDFQCDGSHAHQPCAGSETKATESYTPEMAKAVHWAIREEAVSFRARVSLAAVDVVESEHDEAVRDFDAEPEPEGHREKIGRPGLWCSMVTKTLHPSDPMSRHPGALAAVQKELDDLRSHPAWDEANPVEADELAKTQPEAHVARVFPIIGIKNFEDPSNHVWKGRIVFAGNRVKTATGQWAMFQDMGAVPSTMAACRAILAAYTAVKGSQLFQSDCVKAYVQALMSGTPTYIRLPKAWWPAHWVGKFRDPLCKLLRALYGHPDAGNLWADKIGDELKRLQFVEPEGWTATYVLNADDSHVAVFVLYVDDLVMYGTGRVLEIVEKVRKNIKMDDPTDLKKYLGVVHRIIRTEVDGETLTHVTFDMEQYFRSAIDDYLNLSGTTLSKVASPFAPRVDGEALARLTSEAGEMAEHAAHCVMKLMYGARMALPYLCVIISRLSSQISRWTKDSDRRLHRVYCYLDHSLDVKLRGSLSTADIDSLKLVAWPDADLNGDAQDTKSTSGYYLELIGNHGRGMPLAWGAKKQGSTAVHTAEAEVVSMSTCVRNEAIPMQMLLEMIFRRPIDCEVREDNAAAIVAVTKGYSPTMRHLSRTQRVSLGMLHEIFEKEPVEGEGRIRLVKAETSEHRGDAFTKELESHKFEHALDLIRMTR
jgi:hypothetical protein